MTRISKKVEKFYEKPESIKYTDVVEILIHHGFEKVSTKGSHVKFKHAQLEADIVIPVHNGECKHFYKKEALKQLKKLK